MEQMEQSPSENVGRFNEFLFRCKNLLRRRSVLALSMGALMLTNVGIKVVPEDVMFIEGDRTEACYTIPEIADLDKLEIIDGNIAGNSTFARHLLIKFNPDIATFQEVGGDSSPGIVRSVPCQDGTFGMADFKVNPLGGGQGNLTVSRLKRYSNEYKHAQQGLPNLPELVAGILNWDEYKILDSYKESRSALISTYVVLVDNQKIKLNIANLHAASGPVGDNQLKRFIPFMESSMSDENEINIIIGDVNRSPATIKAMLGQTSSEWQVKDIGPTSRNTGDQIDQIIYKPTYYIGDQLYRFDLKTKVIDDKGSDHRAILSTVNTWPVMSLLDYIKRPKIKKLSPKVN